MPKTIFEYEGVPMSSLESMQFGFWLDKQDFYMNTLEKPERIKIINDWLKNHRENEN